MITMDRRKEAPQGKVLLKFCCSLQPTGLLSGACCVMEETDTILRTCI